MTELPHRVPALPSSVAKPIGPWTPDGAGFSRSLQNARDGESDPVPALAMQFELSPAGGRQFVILGVPIVLARRPFTLHLAILLETVERREKRSRIHLERVVAQSGQFLGDSIAVHWLPAEDRQDHQIERALGNIQLFHGCSFRATR